MESFYGGRQGASFVIKRAFKYLDLEDPAFLCDNKLKYENGEYYSLDKGDKLNKSYVEALGKFSVMSEYVKHPDNKELWYNEYCIIDTENKNNPNNGKIYRRTINETGSELDYPYAEYQGQIVGPSSGAAFLKPQPGLLNFETMRPELIGAKWDGLGVKQDGVLAVYDPAFSGETADAIWPNSDNLELQTEYIQVTDESLVPGAVPSGTYTDGVMTYTAECTDDIKYNWFNVRKNTENDEGVIESWCYIGFQIPYPVFTVAAQYTTPGTAPTVEQREVSEDHPFWWDWLFKIPGGLRGISIEKVFINDNDIDNNDNNDLKTVPAYLFSDLEYDTTEDTYKFKKDAKTIDYSDRGWFCEARIINPDPTSKDKPLLLTQEGAADDKETVTFFLGEITEIDNVVLDTKTGHLEFIYHNQKTDPYDLRYPIDVRMEEETGHVEVEYSYANPDNTEEQKVHEWDFNYPIDVEMNEETGLVTTTYSLIERDENGDSILDEDGKVIHNQKTHQFRYPIDVEMNEETGEITTEYSCEKDGLLKTEKDYFRYPINVDMDPTTGQVTTTYSRETAGVADIGDNVEITNFRYPIDMDMNTETGVITTTYSCETTNVDDTTNPKETTWELNYPINMDMNTSTGVITTTYSTLDDNGEHEQTTWELNYPKSIKFVRDEANTFYTGQFIIDYSAEQNDETVIDGQFGYTREVKVYENEDGQGKIEFINTVDEDSNTFDFVYPTDIIIKPETGECVVDYFGKETKTTTLPLIEDVKVSSAHELLIAYTGDYAWVNSEGYDTWSETNDQGEIVKTYINYGQTIGTLGITSGPMPTEVTQKTTIENIVNWYNEEYPLGQIPKNGEVSGKLHVVTTEPTDGTDPISYFIMWDPDAQKWYQVSEIAGAPVGIPAQIGGLVDENGNEVWTYATNTALADGVIRLVQLEENEEPLVLNFPWM